MSAAATVPAASYRILRRKSLSRQPCLFIPAVRPALLDVRLCGDPCMTPASPERLALFIGDRRLTSVAGLGLESVAFNHLWFTLRNRNPRRRARA